VQFPEILNRETPLWEGHYLSFRVRTLPWFFQERGSNMRSRSRFLLEAGNDTAIDTTSDRELGLGGSDPEAPDNT